MVVNPVFNNAVGVQPASAGVGREADAAQDTSRAPDAALQAVRDASGAGSEPGAVRATEARVVGGADEGAQTDLDSARLDEQQRNTDASNAAAGESRPGQGGSGPGAIVDVFV